MVNRKLNDDDITAFLKLVLEYNNVFYVGDDLYLYKVRNDEPVGLTINNTSLPIRLFSSKIKPEEHIVLNPLKESLGASQERTFFYQFVDALPGSFAFRMIFEILNEYFSSDAPNDKSKSKSDKSEDPNYTKLDLVAKFMDKADSKTINELKLLTPTDILYIFYQKKTKTAQLQSNLWDDEFRNQFGNKIRQKTWSFLTNIISAFIESTNLNDEYKYKSTKVSILEADATFNVFLKTMKSMEPYIKAILNMDLHMSELEEHINNLEAYAKLCSWYSDTTPIVNKPAVNKEPWNNAVLEPKTDTSIVPVTAAPVENPNIPSNCSEFRPQQQNCYQNLPQQFPTNRAISPSMIGQQFNTMPNAWSSLPPPITYANGNKYPYANGRNMVPTMGAAPIAYAPESLPNMFGGYGTPMPPPLGYPYK